jgi:voltage-gated potassium channel
VAKDEKLSKIKWNAQGEDGQVMLSLPWEVFVLGVALLSIANIFLLIFVATDAAAQVIAFVDSILILIFLLDLLRRLNIATDNRAYFVHGWGWLDLLSVIPLLRIARMLRIVRVVRVVGRMGGPSAAGRAFFANKATGDLLLVFLIAIIVLEFGAIGVLWAEHDAPDAQILTAEDAVWYLIVTMSTVGYGDLAPVTTTGRVIGSMIIVVGVGVFGTLTGFLANLFLTPTPAAEVSNSTDAVAAEATATE